MPRQLAISGVGPGVYAYTNKVKALNPIAYWPMAEPSGSVSLDASGNGRNGAYTGVTLGNTGIGDGRTAASFDGATALNNVFSASFAAAVNSAEGTISAWCRVANSGVWTDGTIRRVLSFYVNASNYIILFKLSTNNTMRCDYNAGGTNKTATSTAVGGLTSFFHLAWTWSKSADQTKMYLQGVQVGSTGTGLGTFAGSFTANNMMVGSAEGGGPGAVWNGTLAHVVPFGRALGAAEVASLAVVP